MAAALRQSGNDITIIYVSACALRLSVRREKCLLV